jgi:hypothetical protein
MLPLITGFLWTRHSDQIKDLSIFTQWLTSKALIPWNFGTPEIRSDPTIWVSYILRLHIYLMPYGLFFFEILGLYLAIKETIKFGIKATNLFIITIGVSALVVFIVFVNLYRHDYYYISLSASTAIIAGYGIIRFLQIDLKKKYATALIFTLWAIVSLILNAKDYQRFQAVAAIETQQMRQTLVRAKEAQQYIAKDEWMVSVQYAWDPINVYPFERKTLVVSPRELEKPICPALSDKHFSLVVVGDLNYPNNEQILKKVLGCFKSTSEIMPGVYKIQH